MIACMMYITKSPHWSGKGDIIGIDVASTGKFILTVHSDVHLLLWDLKGKVLATINTNQVSWRRAVGRMAMKSTRRLLGHSLLRSLVHLHRSLIRLLRTTRFARVLRCAQSFDRSLAHSGAYTLFLYKHTFFIAQPGCSYFLGDLSLKCS